VALFSIPAWSGRLARFFAVFYKDRSLKGSDLVEVVKNPRTFDRDHRVGDLGFVFVSQALRCGSSFTCLVFVQLMGADS